MLVDKGPPLAAATGFRSGRNLHIRIKNGPKLLLPATSPDELRSTFWIINEIWFEKVYTPAGFEINDGETVLDIGANLGIFTLFAASRNPHGEIVSCEPLPDLFQLLRHNCSLNHALNVKLLNVGVFSRKGQMTLFRHPRNLGGHSIYVGRTGDSPRAASIEVLPFDDLLDSTHLSHVDFLKMDIEGAEYEVIEGASREALGCVARMAMEYHDVPDPRFSLDRLVEKLTQAGFRVQVAPTGRGLGMIWASHNL